MIINTNYAAMNAQRMFNVNKTQGDKAMQKLSSGKTLNSASDDSAGLAISEKMKAQIRGLDRATLNAKDGAELVKTVDGTLSEITSSLQRLRELSVQASSGVLTKSDNVNIQKEIDQLTKEIDVTTKKTEFNGIKLIDGNLRAIEPTAASIKGESVSSPISIHDDTSAIISTYDSVNFDGGIEIHNGKPAVTELKVNTPFEINAPVNNSLSIKYVDENSEALVRTLSLQNTTHTNPVAETPFDLATVIQDAIKKVI